jgi:hypothetical protein
MRIGIDFDNTLACYDGVFHAAAVESGLIPADGVGTDKTSVRDYLRAQGRDGDFTELQGYVYGPGMKHVRLYPGADVALDMLKRRGAELFVISHKTRAPFAGPAYDLHKHAREFLTAQRLVDTEGAHFAPEHIFFELTKTDKVARAAELGCKIFIDDLPEILAMEGFAPGTRKVLFDPHGHYPGGDWQGRSFERFERWDAIADTILVRAA